MFNNSIQIKHKLDEKINLYSCYFCCICCGFKKFVTIGEKDIPVLYYCLKCRKKYGK